MFYVLTSISNDHSSGENESNQGKISKRTVNSLAKNTDKIYRTVTAIN